MFETGYPVILSSGRSAIYLALSHLNVTRHDLIGSFPFASHCVLDSISRIATPLSGVKANNASIQLIYHQWSYINNSSYFANYLIEDCVDILCLKGTSLFPKNGQFEIWSLPKILGTTSGAVL